MSEPLTDAEWAEIQEWCAVNPNVRISEEGSILITRDGALQAVVHPRTFLDVVRSTLTVDTIRECAKQLKAANIQPGSTYRWVDTLAPIREKLPITDEARGECCAVCHVPATEHSLGRCMDCGQWICGRESHQCVSSGRLTEISIPGVES